MANTPKVVIRQPILTKVAFVGKKSGECVSWPYTALAQIVTASVGEDRFRNRLVSGPGQN